VKTYFDGTKYDGEFDSNGLKHGHGKIVYSNETTYEGDFKNGLRDGYGILTSSKQE